MTDGRREIFRGEALLRYTENRNRAVLPNAIRSQIFRALWVLSSGLFGALVYVGAQTHLAQEVTGVGVVVPRAGLADSTTMLVVVASEDRARLRVDHRISVRVGPGVGRAGYLVSVDGGTYSARGLTARFGRSAAAARWVTFPCAVAVAVLGGPRSGGSELLDGAAYPVTVTAGTRPLAAAVLW